MGVASRLTHVSDLGIYGHLFRLLFCFIGSVFCRSMLHLDDLMSLFVLLAPFIRLRPHRQLNEVWKRGSALLLRLPELEHRLT